MKKSSHPRKQIINLKQSILVYILCLTTLTINISKVKSQSCPTSPICPNNNFKMINSLGTPLEWVETQTVFCDGERITLSTNSYTSTTITATTIFGQEFNFRSDGGRIGQLTNGDYVFGETIDLTLWEMIS